MATKRFGSMSARDFGTVNKMIKFRMMNSAELEDVARIKAWITNNDDVDVCQRHDPLPWDSYPYMNFSGM